ncbi:ComF family protein [Paenibacillus marinisediminis]
MAHGLAANRSVVQYDAVMKEWLSRFKFKGEIRFAQLLAGMMLERYEDVYQRTELANRSSQSSGFLQGIRDLVVQGNRSRLSYPDVVTFVPSSTERLQDRGFNQAALVAELLAQAWKRPLLPALSRMRDDARQSHQSRSGRERSMQGAYRSNHEVLSRIVSGNSSSVSIMLVDDVFTTGNTLRACTDALRRGLDEAGIKSTIWSYTWARA